MNDEEKFQKMKRLARDPIEVQRHLMPSDDPDPLRAALEEVAIKIGAVVRPHAIHSLTHGGINRRQCSRCTVERAVLEHVGPLLERVVREAKEDTARLDWILSLKPAAHSWFLVKFERLGEEERFTLLPSREAIDAARALPLDAGEVK